ncbi:MAG TPA: hypothetical protein VJH97_03710 [Candidatus Nanoarchaeia archaeon]|nr:hypothetical protein [Candidatus Nanoarchaeia archaeon]
MARKGQAAMEFLMTYGWAILVVLVAIGALAYFGVLNPDTFLPEKCVISSGSGLFCDKFSVSSGTSIQLKVSNSLAEAVTLEASGSSISQGANSCTLAADTAVTADNSSTLTFSGGGTCATLTASGAKIKGDITLVFTDSDGFSKTTTGSLVAKAP